MLVEQALFTSAQTRQARGYHLVARSPGVDDSLAQRLSVWGPTHDSLLEDGVGLQSLNYFAAEDGWGVLSRTVNGQSEYSGRGGFRLETNMLVVRREQLAGYGDHPLLFARTALALGHLRLRAAAPATLSPVKLPGGSVLASRIGKVGDLRRQSLVERVLDEITQNRVAIIGAADLLSVVSNVLDRLPPESRATLSFTTGLKPSLQRTFNLQFLPSADRRLREELTAAGIVCIDADGS